MDFTQLTKNNIGSSFIKILPQVISFCKFKGSISYCMFWKNTRSPNFFFACKLIFFFTLILKDGYLSSNFSAISWLIFINSTNLGDFFELSINILSSPSYAKSIGYLILIILITTKKRKKRCLRKISCYLIILSWIKEAINLM